MSVPDELDRRCLSVYFDSRRVSFRCLQARDVGGAVLSAPGQIRERNVMADKTTEDDTRLVFWLKHSGIFK